MKYDHPFRSAKINLIKKQNSGDLDALEALKKRKNLKKEKLLEILRQNWIMYLKAKR